MEGAIGRNKANCWRTMSQLRWLVLVIQIIYVLAEVGLSEKERVLGVAGAEVGLTGVSGSGPTEVWGRTCGVANGGCSLNAGCVELSGKDAFNSSVVVCSCLPGFVGNGLSCWPDLCSAYGEEGTACSNGIGSPGVFCRNVDFKRNTIECVCSDVSNPNCNVTCGSGFYQESSKNSSVGNSSAVCGLSICNSSSNGGCPESFSCENKSPGSVACSGKELPESSTFSCQKGYFSDPVSKACAKDFCAINNGGCAENALCEYELSEEGIVKHTCSCLDGFFGNGTFCEPDPCLNSTTRKCLPGETCRVNADGKQTCSACRQGYVDIGSKCVVDLCETFIPKSEQGACSHATACKVTGVESVQCTCDEGYTQIGNVCMEAKCKVNNGGCGKNTTCLYSATGDVLCGKNCSAGLVKTGDVCYSDTCNGQSGFGDCGSNSTSCSIGISGSAECACDSGYTQWRECAKSGCNSTSCQKSEFCYSMEPRQGISFETVVCSACESGFISVDGKCVEDVCAVNGGLGSCGSGAERCEVDSTGMASCVCLSGYIAVNDTCIEDPCWASNGGCGNYTECKVNMINMTSECGNCTEGYVSINGTCSVDLCFANSGIGPCGVNSSDCSMLEGSVQCVCKKGYIESYDGRCIQDLCESKNGGCGDHILCNTLSNPLFPFGFVSCSLNCDKGFVKVDGICYEDLCSVANSTVTTCGVGALSCDIVSDGLKSCKCNDTSVVINGVCEYNKCLTNNGGCPDNNLCTIDAQNYTTVCGECKPGYVNVDDQCLEDSCKWSEDGSTSVCGTVGIDAKSCVVQPSGMPLCECEQMYISINNTCVFDECAVDNGGCEQNWSCEMNVTGVNCPSCIENYAQVGEECFFDLCSSSVDICGINSTSCVVVGDQNVTCGCDEGFVQVGNVCLFDYCAIDNAGCGVNAECTLESDGPGFSCGNCLPGYVNASGSCVVDICKSDSTGEDPCGAFSQGCTVVSNNSVQCDCVSGFTQIGNTCKVDLCAIEGSCFNRTCALDQFGQPQCGATCKPGYSVVQGVCVKDYCSSNVCGEFTETCSNTLDGYTCTCESNYVFLGGTCIYNQCEENGCGLHFECIPTEDGVACPNACMPGYVYVNGECKIDACSDVYGSCPENSRCIADKNNERECICYSDFIPVQIKGKLRCIENKCKTDSSICDPNAECSQDKFTVTCRCVSPYVGNGTHCELAACNATSCPQNSTCDTSQANRGCLCKDNYTRNVENGNCTLIVPCDPFKSESCENKNAVCIDFDGVNGFRCVEYGTIYDSSLSNANYLLLRGNNVIGKNVTIGLNVTFGKYASVGYNSSIRDFVELEQASVVQTSAVMSNFSKLGQGSMLMDKSFIDKFSSISKRVSIGAHTIIGANTTIRSDTVISSNNSIGYGFHAGERCKLGKNIVIKNNTYLNGNVTVADNVTLERGVTVSEGATVPANTVVGEDETYPRVIPTSSTATPTFTPTGGGLPDSEDSSGDNTDLVIGISVGIGSALIIITGLGILLMRKYRRDKVTKDLLAYDSSGEYSAGSSSNGHRRTSQQSRKGSSIDSGLSNPEMNFELPSRIAIH
eukprot:Nk52_evm10s218 gene=Nk52_evmTU10s218